MRIVLLLLFTLSLLSCKQDNWGLMDRAFAYGDKGDYERAIRLLDRIIVNLNNEIESERRTSGIWLLYQDVHILRGIYKFNLGDTMGARKDYDYIVNFRKLRGNLPDPLAHFSRARLFRSQEKYELAYLDIMQTYSHIRDALDRGNIYMGLPGRLSRNIPLRFIQLERAVIYFGLDSLENALDDINFCLTFENLQDTAFYWRGKILLRQGDTINACADWRRIADLGLNSARAKIERYCE